jgi:hypothetical protein
MCYRAGPKERKGVRKVEIHHNGRRLGITPPATQEARRPQPAPHERSTQAKRHSKPMPQLTKTEQYVNTTSAAPHAAETNPTATLDKKKKKRKRNEPERGEEEEAAAMTRRRASRAVWSCPCLGAPHRRKAHHRRSSDGEMTREVRRREGAVKDGLCGQRDSGRSWSTGGQALGIGERR